MDLRIKFDEEQLSTIIDSLERIVQGFSPEGYRGYTRGKLMAKDFPDDEEPDDMQVCKALRFKASEIPPEHLDSEPPATEKLWDGDYVWESDEDQGSDDSETAEKPHKGIDQEWNTLKHRAVSLKLYYAVSEISWLPLKINLISNAVRAVISKELTQLSLEMGYAVSQKKTIYGHFVKSYHQNVTEALKKKINRDQDFLAKFRVRS